MNTAQMSALDEIIGNACNIVFFGGAGVSTESGIPDFRSEKGLLRAKSEYGHSPEYLVSHTAFATETELFFRYYRENLICSSAKPNPAHLALAKLEREGKLAAIVTQNIDGLHQAAGSKVVHELHGSIHRNHCINCGAAYTLSFIINSEGIARCEDCGGIVKPDVVLYEEPLDSAVMRAAELAVLAADTMIVGGTSLVVYPAAGYVDLFRAQATSDSRLVFINKGATEKDAGAHLIIRENIGEVLGRYL